MARTLVPAAVLLLAVPNLAHGEDRFEHTAVYLEQTVQDADAEVKFEVIGGNAGLATLRVAAPDGRIVVDFKAPDSKLGLRHVTLESPEPKNDGTLQADFPAGLYRFTGTTVSGATLQGEAALSHAFPGPTSFLHPRAEERNLPSTGLQVKWSPVKDLAATIMVIEQEKTGREIRVNLPGTATAFAVPDGFLLPGTAYKLAIGTVSKEGNRSVIETEFTTAAKR
jgi:hypothetical protein